MHMQTDARKAGEYLSTPLISRNSGKIEREGWKSEEKRSGAERRRKWSMQGKHVTEMNILFNIRRSNGETASNQMNT